MSSNKSHRISQKGVSFLEFSVMLSILTAFTISGILLSDYIRVSRFIRDELGKTSTHYATSPFLVKYDSDQLSVDIDDQAVEKVASASIENLETSLKLYLSNFDSKVQSYRIEVGYREFAVNEASGALEKAGSNSVFNLKQVENSFSQIPLKPLEQIVSEVSVQKDKHGAQNLYAIPLSSNVFEAQGKNYLPKFILIGVRMSVSFEDTMLGFLLDSMGIDSTIYDYRVLSMRGEIKYEG